MKKTKEIFFQKELFSNSGVLNSGNHLKNLVMNNRYSFFYGFLRFQTNKLETVFD